jgi:tRNA(Ile2) C34 agmatinyltransferase TiaS
MVDMKVTCGNCGYSWDYHGKTQWYLACPKCKNTININELTDKHRNKMKKDDLMINPLKK